MSNETSVDMRMIRFNCSGCNKRLKAPVDKVGRNSKCNSCGTSVVIPQGDSEEELLCDDDDKTLPMPSKPSPLPLPASVPPPLPPLASGPPPLPPQLAAPLARLVMEEKPCWYYSVNGIPSGPLTTRALAPILRSMSSNHTLLIWRDGMSDWKHPEQCSEWKEASAALAASLRNHSSFGSVPFHLYLFNTLEGRAWLLVLCPILAGVIVAIMGYNPPLWLWGAFWYGAIFIDYSQLKKERVNVDFFYKYLLVIVLFGMLGYLYARAKQYQYGFQQFAVLLIVVLFSLVVQFALPKSNVPIFEKASSAIHSR